MHAYTLGAVNAQRPIVMSDVIHRCLIALACITCIAGGVGCGGASTTFESTWGRPTSVGAVQRVVVLYDTQDGALRRNVEDAMTRKLLQRGFKAVTSYAVLGSAEMEDLATAKAALREKGFDGLVEIRFIDADKDITHSGYVNAYGGFGYWGGWYGPSYYVDETTTVRVETNLYSLRDDELLWSARSKTVDADDTREVVEEVTSLVASTLDRGAAAATTARR